MKITLTRTPILTESGCIDSEMEVDPGKAKIKVFLGEAEKAAER